MKINGTASVDAKTNKITNVADATVITCPAALGYSIETAELTASSGVVTINGQKYVAGVNGALKFASGTNEVYLSEGTVALAADDDNKKAYVEDSTNALTLATTGATATVAVKDSSVSITTGTTDGTELTNVPTNATITTGTLSDTNTIVVDGTTYTAKGSGALGITKSAAAGTAGSYLTSGKVTIGENGVAYGSGTEQVVTTTDSDATLAVSGSTQTISGLSAGFSVTVGKTDATKTVYAETAAGVVTKTVNGTTEIIGAVASAADVGDFTIAGGIVAGTPSNVSAAAALVADNVLALTALTATTKVTDATGSKIYGTVAYTAESKAYALTFETSNGLTGIDVKAVSSDSTVTLATTNLTPASLEVTISDKTKISAMTATDPITITSGVVSNVTALTLTGTEVSTAADVAVKTSKSGTFDVNGLKYTTAHTGDGEAEVTVKADKTKANTATTLTVSGLGATETFTTVSTMNVTMGDTSGTEWTKVSAGVTFTGAASDTAATASLDAGESATIATYAITANKGTITVANDGKVSAIEKGDEFTVGTVKYTAYDDNYLIGVDSSGGAVTSYAINSGKTWTDVVFDPANSSHTAITAKTAGAIALTSASTASAWMADGVEVPVGYTGAAATYTTGETNTFAATSQVTAGVTITALAVSVTDTSGETVYTLATANNSTVKGEGFAVDAAGKITDASKTLTLTSATTITTTDGDGKFALTNTTASAKITFGTDVTAIDGAEIQLDAGNEGSKIVLTEETNGTATVVDGTGAIAGFDAGGVVTGVPADMTVETVGDGTYSVNGIEFTTSGDTSSFVTVAPDDVEATKLTVTNLASGEKFTLGTNAGVSLSGKEWTSVSKGVEFDGNNTAKLTSGQFATVATYTISDVTSSDGVTVTSTGTVSGLGAGESVKITDTSTKDYKIFTAVSATKVTVFDSSTGSTTIYGNAAITAPDTDTFTYGTVATSWNSATDTASGIVTSNISVTTNYSSLGAPGATGDNIAATVTVNGTSSKTVSVLKELSSVVVDISDDAATITVSDTTGNTTVKTQNGTISGKSFTAVKDGTNTVISNATDGIKALSGSVVAGSSFNVDASAAATSAAATDTVVSYVAGASLSEAKVTVKGSSQITLTESSNTVTTEIKADGTISGLEGDSTVTGAVNGTTITTTNSGATSINGTTWSVEGDDDGVAYTVADSTKGKISDITGLATGAKVSTTADVSGTTIGKITIDSAKSGLSITQTASGQDIALATTGDSIAYNSVTYKVDASLDGIVVSTTGTITGLTDGEKVTVDNGTATTYEVTGTTLVKTVGGVTTTSVLAEGEENGFTIASDGSITNASKSATDTASTGGGLQLGSGATAVTTVTNGVLVDKNGSAVVSEEKAVATIAIEDNGSKLDYQAQSNIAQTVTVNKDAAGSTVNNYDWAINTGAGGDTVTYNADKEATINVGDGKNTVTTNGKGDVSVTAGSGNDVITINGTGEAVVQVAGGNNRIARTNTTGAATLGTATLAGGTGNDTISSANADDVITGGEGKNTFQMTGNTTNTISDFTFGSDVAAAAAYTGTLALDSINVTGDGKISYGAKATNGEVDVSATAGETGFYAVTLADANGQNKRNVGWTGEDGGMINASDITTQVVLIGNSAGAADTLIGGQSSDTLKAGTGESSLWGGKGHDLLISNAADSTSFFFLEGDGRDTVQGFTAYTEANADTADKLDFAGQGVTGIKNTAEGIKVYHGSDSMLLSGTYSANDMIQWKSGDAQGIAKIGKQGTDNTFAYDAAVTGYFGSSKTDAVSLGAADSANVWLDGSQGVAYDSIEVINASQVTGDAVLAGSTGSNTITGGQGASSLWGGTGAYNDTLIAGSGTNTFFYGLGDGNDVINNSRSGDTVNLFSLNLSDLTGAEIESNKITVTQSNGQTLTVNGQANTFTLADGSTWQADRSTKTWSQAQ